jgi:glyoxylase-like metal-dependent hydrolase (beta-lactamase superfamily II)
VSIWQEVGPGVYVRRYAFLDQAIGAVVGDEGVLVVDTRTTATQAEEIRRDIRELGTRPLVAVVDTHMHWDHTWGNSAFSDVPIWGHDRCASALEALRDEDRLAPILDELIARYPDLEEDLLDVEIRPPDRTFADRALVERVGRPVELRHLGRGHTDNDVVVLVPDGTSAGAGDGVVFAGDLLESGAPPWFGDGFPMDWSTTLDGLLGLLPAIVVPGHGAPGDLRFARAQRDEIAAIAELAREVHADELSLEEAVSSGPYPPDTMTEALDRALRQLRGELD